MLESLGLFVVALSLIGAGASLVFTPDRAEFAPEGVVLATFVGAILIGVPYTRRWRGNAWDGLIVITAAWALMVLPVLPLVFQRDASPLPLVVTYVYALLLSQMSKTQGRYLYTERKIPELEGESRALAAAVVERAGLRPLAILVASLAAFNAMVQGLRSCIVLIDQRAARELPPDELSALVAHEAGHLKFAHTLFLLGMPCLAVTVAAMVGDDSQSVLIVGAALYFGLRPALSQALEFRSDEFAESLVGSATVARMLARVHADRPKELDRTIEDPWVAAFMTHPTAESRIARLEGRRPNVPVTLGLAHLLRWGLTAAAVWLTLSEPRPRLWASVAVVMLFLMSLVASVRVRLAAHRSYRISMAAGSGGTLALVNYVFVYGGLLAVLVAIGLAPRDQRVATFVLGMFPWAFGMLILKGFIQSRRTALTLQSKGVRAAVMEALAAAGEGRAQEGLDALARVASGDARNAWVLAARGVCQLHAGQSKEAQGSLEDAVKVAPDFAYAHYMLGFRHYLAGDSAAAKQALENLVVFAAADPLTWTLKGMVHRDAGELAESRAAYEKSLALRSADVGPRVGLAHVILDEGGPAGEAERAIRNAVEVAARSPQVLVLQARWLQRNGRATEAESAFKEAMGLLSPAERLLQPKCESLARAWGILK